MSRSPRLVLDTNVVLSALLWDGRPGELILLAGEGQVRLFTSQVLLEELSATSRRAKLARALAATGCAATELVDDYRRLSRVVRPAALDPPLCRDPDDGHVLACAMSARTDYLVTGDDDLLTLGIIQGVSIVNVAAMLATIR